MSVNNNQEAIELLAKQIVQTMHELQAQNNQKYVAKEIKNASVSVSNIRGLGKIVAEQVGNVEITADKIQGLDSQVEQLVETKFEKVTITAAQIQDLSAVVAKIVLAEIGNATIDTAQIRDLSVKVADIVVATIEKADIEWADIVNLTAAVANISLAQIKDARIDFAQIDGLVAGQALITEAVGGKVLIQDLSVTDANIVNLNANKITSGTLEVERLVIVGSEKSIVYAINDANGTAQLSQTTIDGGSITRKTITADQIVAQGITAECLDVTEIFANEALVGVITTSHLSAGCVTATQLAAGAVTAEKIEASSVQAKHLSADSVTADKIKAGSVSTDKLEAGAVTAEKIAANAITAEKLDAGAVTAEKIAANAIEADKIKANAITGDKIAANTITVNKLASDVGSGLDLSSNQSINLTVKKAVDDIEIGGRNLLKNSKGGFVVFPQDAAFASYPFSFVPTLGETYTFSADVEITDGNFDKISVYPYPSEYAMLTHVPIPANGRIVHTFTARHDTITTILVYAGVAGETRGNGVIFRNVKIEKGNKATDWTAAPEDTEAVIDGLATRVTEAEAEIAVQAGEIQMAVSEINNISVGGRNLLLDSGREVTNNLYTVATYEPETPLVPGETYAFSLCVTPGANVTHIVPYVSGGNVGLGTFYVNGTEKQTVTFIDKMRDYYPGRTPEDNIANANVHFVRFPNDGTTGSTTIHWVKIEKGNKATDWTPAPEDPVQTLKNTAMTLNADGIDMTTTGHFRLYANDGKNSRIKLGGDNATANFSVDETGALGAVSGDFAQGLSVGNYPVWTKQNIIISSNEPTGVHDVLWIQPLQGVQQASHSCVNTSQTHFTGGNAISYSLSPETSDVLSSGGNYSYSLSLRMTLGEDTTTVKTFTVSAVLSTSAGSVTLSGVAVSLSGWKTTQITLTGTSSVNLCAAKNNIAAAVKVSGGSGNNTYMYIPRNTSLILTSKNTSASSAGAQTCTIHYIP